MLPMILCSNSKVLISRSSLLKGVKVDHKGQCLKDPPMARGTYHENGSVSMKTMKLYEEEGFRLVSRRRYSETPFDGPHGSSEGRRERTVRLTADGLEYRTEIANDDGDDAERMLFGVTSDEFTNASRDGPSFGLNTIAEEATGVRELNINGKDDRIMVGKDLSFPNRLVGELDYSFAHWEGGCTGTVISQDFILTAGRFTLSDPREC